MTIPLFDFARTIRVKVRDPNLSSRCIKCEPSSLASSRINQPGITLRSSLAFQLLAFIGVSYRFVIRARICVHVTPNVIIIGRLYSHISICIDNRGRKRAESGGASDLVSLSFPVAFVPSDAGLTLAFRSASSHQTT